MIATEHHLIQVNQVIAQYELKSSDYLIWFINSTNTDWIDRVVKGNEFKHFVVSESWNFSELRSKSLKVKEFFSLLEKTKSNSPPIRFFYSQYSSDFSLCAIHVLAPKEIILLDEGTASFAICARRKNFSFADNFKILVKSFYYKKIIYFPKKIKYFSQYDLQVAARDSIYKYTFIKENNDYLKFNDSEVAFLGSSLVEVDLLTFDYYLHLMVIIKSSFPNRKLLYFPHRKENKIKIEAINKIGFEIKEIDQPFEFYFSKLSVCPGTICSFFTPTIMNLDAKYNLTPHFVIYKFDLLKLKFNRDVVTKIYEGYNCKNHIKIVNLF
jgi:hypothetical protein